jgi:hypothetical protein
MEGWPPWSDPPPSPRLRSARPTARARATRRLSCNSDARRVACISAKKAWLNSSPPGCAPGCALSCALSWALICAAVSAAVRPFFAPLSAESAAPRMACFFLQTENKNIMTRTITILLEGFEHVRKLFLK